MALFFAISLHAQRKVHILPVSNELTNNLISLQIIDASTQFIVDEKKSLYLIENGIPSKINTPINLNIESYTFKNKDEGIVVGKIHKDQLNALIPNAITNYPSDSTYYSAYFEPVYSGHYLIQRDSMATCIAYTKDMGKNWKFSPLKTNFSVSSCHFNDAYFFITTESGEHHDGDVWKYTPELGAYGLYRALRCIYGLIPLKGGFYGYGSTNLSLVHIDLNLFHLFSSKKKKEARRQAVLNRTRNNKPGQLIFFNEQADQYTALKIDSNSTVISSDLVDDSTIWLATNTGMLTLVDGTKSIHTSKTTLNIRSIIALNKDELLILTKTGDLFTGKYTENTISITPFEILQPQFIRAIYRSEDQVYLLGNTGFLAYFNY